MLPNFVRLTLRPGERLRALEGAGAGYGAPLSRDPHRVLHDVEEGWETHDRARDIYGVVLSAPAAGAPLAVDEAATRARRQALSLRVRRDRGAESSRSPA